MYHEPYPLYVDDASGCRVSDVDGNEYLDFFNNATALIHGHTDSSVIEAATERILAGSAPGAPTTAEVKLAEHLCGRVEGIERIRFTNSGSEATANAIKAARAYTGRTLVAKFEGIYHGAHTDADFSVHPPLHLAGPPSAPNSVPESAGLPAEKGADVLMLPFNDSGAVESILSQHRSDLAGVIVGPHMGSNVIPGEDAFIHSLREYTAESDILLIFDESMSFRAAHGGIQARYDVVPDLITLGKMIGGGFPIGAFGGRTALLDQFAPGNPVIAHSGTYNANPVSTAAGLAALEGYTKAEIDRLNRLTTDLVERIEAIAEDHGIGLSVNRCGSLFNIYFDHRCPRNYRDALRTATELEGILHWLLLTRGVRIAPKGYGALSTPMSSDEVDEFVSGFDHIAGALRQAVQTHAPALLVD